MESRTCSRREFVVQSTSCATHLAMMAAAMPLLPKRAWAAQERFPVVADEPWGRLEQITDGVWALVSTPLADRLTLCNGGIVAGRLGVVLVESFASDDGARWMAAQAEELTGRPPTHVLVTHYHGDHTGGLTGATDSGDPAVLATSVTRDTTLERNSSAPAGILANVDVIGARRPTEIDLGDRSLIVVPRRGHTESDVTLEVTDPNVIFCGDLVWNGMFPNYVDATPSRLTQNVRLLRQLDASTTYVPGHGPLADADALDRYIDLLDDVEDAARTAIERGMSAEEAGGVYSLPTGMEEWTLFNPGYFARAIGAWMTELGAVAR